MQERTTLSISIQFTDEHAIKRVKQLYGQDRFSHAQIYMRGVESIQKELEQSGQ